MAVSVAIQSDVGVIGLDGMGRNVALHLADLHFNVAAYDWRPHRTLTLEEQTTGPGLRVTRDVSELFGCLRRPRTILIFSSADAPMNFVLDQLLPRLEPEDLLVDAGDSYFKDTALRGRLLGQAFVHFMAVGLAGGEKGARHGAIVMSGGGRAASQRMGPLLEAMAATVHGEPCVSSFETAAAAHFVKMVHAGVEYAIMELLSETLDLLQRTLLLTDEELQDDSGAWHMGILNGYLMEISGRVFEPVDKQTPRLLLREKLGAAKTDPLGRWVTQSARELQVPIPTIEAAAGAQGVAVTERRRALLAAPFRQPVGRFGNDSMSVLDELHGALHAAMIIAYAQGMALLTAASQQHGFQFNLHEISRAWRGCTHLRTSLLDNITAALQATPDLADLLSDDDLSQSVMDSQESLRHAVWRAQQLDTVAPGLLASLDYLDSDRAAWLPVNLIEGPRCQPARAAQLAAAG